MKKHFLQLLVMFLVVSPVMVFAQKPLVALNFDTAVKDTMVTTSKEGKTVIKLADDAVNKKGGTGSLNFAAWIDSVQQWGSYAQFHYIPKDATKKATTLDLSTYDSVSVWVKVNVDSKHPENLVFRVQLADKGPNGTDLEEQYIYENGTVIDKKADWYLLRFPLIERNQPGTDIPNGDGFILAPTSWGGFSYNNKTLDRAKITQITVGFITSGWAAPLNIPPDSVNVNVDELTFSGARNAPVTFFNGKVLGSMFTNYGGWGGSSVAVEANAGSAAKKSALVWTMAGTGGTDQWSGLYFDMTPTQMAGNFIKGDSLKMKVKAAPGTPAIRIQFIGGPGAIKWVLDEATYKWDNTWKTISLPLKSYKVSDGKLGFDSTAVSKFEILTENAGAINTKIYFDDMWVGSPVFDVVAPEAVTTLKVTAGAYSNFITWKDVPNETGAKYDVYYSTTPITSIDQKGIEVVATGIAENTMTASHLLRAPNTDQNVSYYYAVVCTDAAGNVGAVAATPAAASTKAKGVPTISLTVPTNFTVNGTLTEWTAAGIKPIAIKSSDGTGTIKTNTKIDGDADLSVLSYLAVDKDNLYFAFDVTDDAVYGDTTAAAKDYERDCPDLFIGLYDFHGAYHKSYARGATPDYHFRFAKNKCYFDGQGSSSLIMPGANYVWKEKLSGGYTVEGKVSWKDIATKRNSDWTGGADNIFVPVEGMRIPIDYSINDNDNGSSREGILCYSPMNDDQSWGDVTRWLYTWIGNKMFVTGVEQIDNGVVKNYELSQNYPNPFNPTTTIRYAITKPGMVSLKVYDVVGREVATLLNQEMSAGSYQVNFDASALSSGIYFYRLQSGEFTATNKMMLVK